jgi:hypothetical protein
MKNTNTAEQHRNQGGTLDEAAGILHIKAFRILTSRWSEDLTLRFSYRAVGATSPLFPG